MPRKYKLCSVFNCPSNTSHDKYAGLEYFYFPTNEDRMKQWLLFCNNPTLNNLTFTNLIKHRTVCSIHFTSSSMKCSTRKLIKSAVPSVNGPLCVSGMNEESTISPSNNNLFELMSPSRNSHDLPLNFSDFRKRPLEDSNELDDIEVKRQHKRQALPTTTKFGSPKSGPLKLSHINLTRKKVIVSSPRKSYLYSSVKRKEKALRSLKKKYKHLKEMSVTDIHANAKQNGFNDLTAFSKSMTKAAWTLLSCQIGCFKKKPKGRRWSMDEKILALSLYKKSPTMYRLLRTMFILPAKCTLSKILQGMHFKTGVNHKIFNTLTDSINNLEECDKLAILTYDEMYIREHLSYDTATDQIFGVEDQGELGKWNKNATHVLVFMISGLIKKWKQPVAYYFSARKGVSSKMLLTHLKNVISACSKAGIKILATICDMGATFVQAMKKLGVNKDKPYYYMEGQRIIVLFDPPHLIKCTRNMLQKHDVAFKLQIGSLDFEGTARWKDVEEAYQRDKTAGTFRWLWKLTDAHLDPVYKKKMKVKLATQVLSHSMAATINKDVSLGLAGGGALATAHFVEFCDKLFDSFNGTHKKDPGGKQLKCSLSNTSPHHAFWKDAAATINDWKFLVRKDDNTENGEYSIVRPPSQDGWLISIRGMQLLWEEVQKYVKNGRPIQFLMLRNINQDKLENLFCCVRSYCGSNNNPTAPQFVAAFKTVIINGLAFKGIRGNCEADNTKLLSNLQCLLESKPSSSDMSKPRDIDSDEVGHKEPVGDYDSFSHLIDSSSTAYVSGFISRKILANNNCDKCRAGLLNSSPDELWCSGIYFKEYSGDKLRLTYPSEGLVRTVGQIATLLENFLEHHFHQERIVEFVTNVTLQEVDFSWFHAHCSVHQQEVFSKVLKSVCRITIPWWCKKKNRDLKQFKK